MALYGQSWLRSEQQRGDALKRQRDEVLNQALKMATNDKYILALRKELEWHKENARQWERSAGENSSDIDEILKAANVTTIPELMSVLNN